MWYWVLLPVLFAPYWLGPIVVWLTQRAGARPLFEPFVPARHQVPPDVAAALTQTCDALGREGFHVVADLFLAGHVKHVSTRAVLLENGATDEVALAVAAFSAARPARLAACYVELPTKLGDGRSVTVNNNPRAGAFTSARSRIVVRFPDVRDPGRLCRIKRAYLERYYRGVERVPFEHQGDPARLLSDAMVRELEEQVEAGMWWRDDVAQVFRPTFVGAWVMSWKLLPPFRAIRTARLRRRAAAVLRELGMDGGDSSPIAQPRTRYSIAWILIVAVTVFLVTRYGSVALRRFGVPGESARASLPADFAVPVDFRGAVRALERLAGAEATPLVGMDSLGDSLATEGFAVSVSAARAEGLIAAAQASFLEKGFYLFRAEQHFGIQNQPDRVALFPRRDPYEIVRLMGTNGANYGIGPDSIVGWLTALERDQPFVLTGIAFDWVEGRFTTAVRDPAALARRFHAFCPDIVEQGTGTVDALAHELEQSQRLYCWWD
ncbi:MAG TPA: DUF4253 domain-containing protein [Gemmatimonadales bacterium]|nr:DUF4253 domain-containing protein [Gemmatimonadales bacterium]